MSHRVYHRYQQFAQLAQDRYKETGALIWAALMHTCIALSLDPTIPDE